MVVRLQAQLVALVIICAVHGVIELLAKRREVRAWWASRRSRRAVP